MFTIAAFAESQSEAGTATEIKAVPDQSVSAVGDVLYTPKFNNIVGMWAAMGAANQGNPYIDTPSLRRIALYDIPRVYGATVIANHDDLHMFPNSPLKLTEGEGIKIFSDATPGADEYHSCVLMFSDGAITSKPGETFMLRATATITGTAGAWENGNITFTQTLPVGRYEIVGCTCLAANAIAFRLVGLETAHRPGGPPIAALTDSINPLFLNGGLGTWLSFHSLAPPTLDILAVAACVAQTLYLNLRKIG